MNALTALSPTYWSKTMQKKLYKTNVFRNIASFREESVLTDGQEVDRPYRAALKTQKITRGAALNTQTLTATSDKLIVDKHYGALFYLDKIDKVQNKYDVARESAEEVAEHLNNDIDAECLFTAVDAADTVDHNDIDSAQTAGLGAVITTANIYKMFTVAGRKLTKANVPMEDRVAVITPEVHQTLIEYFGGKESALGDRTSEAGSIGRAFGFQLYTSNNVPGSARWTPADLPADGATITIGGITYTGETGTLDAEGKFKIETSDLPATLANIAAAINGGGAAVSGKFYGLSEDDQMTSKKFYAVATATYITVYHKGTANISVASSESADVWSHKKQHCYFGQRKSTDLVIQMRPNVESASTVAAGKLGMNFLSSTLFGVDTPQERKSRILNVEIDASNY